MINRKRLLPLLASMLTGVSLNGAMAETPPRPNIIYIMADDLGWVDIGSELATGRHGSHYHETPTIDALAKRGMSFTRAYTQQNCAPTRTALLSGQYAPHNGNGLYNVGSLNRPNEETPGYDGKKPNNGLAIVPPEQNVTMPDSGYTLLETMHKGGYHTAWIGKVQRGRVLGVDADYSTSNNPFTIGRVDGKRARKGYLALEETNRDGDTSDSIADNTLVIFTSDNGGTPHGRKRSDRVNAPLRGIKGDFFEGGIRVPLIARWPGTIAPGAVSGEPVHCVDVYPTLAGIAGVALPDPGAHALDGVSFAPILRGEAKELKRRALYWHFPGYLDTRQPTPQSMSIAKFKGKTYKLRYLYENGSYEHYNLTDDMSEATNLLGADPDAAPIARKMNDGLRQWLIDLKAPAGTWAGNGETVPYPPAGGPDLMTTRKQIIHHARAGSVHCDRGRFQPCGVLIKISYEV